jgi:hypothetical protein
MKINSGKLSSLVLLLKSNGLLSADEAMSVSSLAKNTFAFKPQLMIADSLHLHIHINDVTELPGTLLLEKIGIIVRQAKGYVKYAFEGGVHVIFSDIPVAEEENIGNGSLPYLDHIGIDIRSDDKPAYLIFQQIPLICAEKDYLFKRQGDGRDNVGCCHMQVKEKYWVYPKERLNFEFAFGPLMISEIGFGVDLRPANPLVKVNDGAATCCSDVKVTNIGIPINKDIEVQNHSIVSLRYIMKNAEGEVMEDNTHGKAVEYVHGSGNMLTALEFEMMGLKPGDQKSFFITDKQFKGTLHFDVFIDNVRMASKEEVRTGKSMQQKKQPEE